MYYIFKSRIHVAAAFIILITVIFILHEILFKESPPPPPHESITLKLESQQPLTQAGKKLDASADFMRQLISASYKINRNFTGEKYVHLDLKGAPPSVSYLKRLFPLLKTIGATGVLIEYEDMFPYNESLENIPAYNAYNESDIKSILLYAERNGLNVIPLVQTFGHLEFVLKLQEYRDLREVPMYPQVICPTHQKTNTLIFTMIDQVIALHPGITHLHIGSDEVYHIGRCDRCTHTMEENHWTKEHLFLAHLRNVTNYLKRRHPTIRPIIWDDELRSLSEEIILDFDVAKNTDIMVWKYTQAVGEFITDPILEKYSKLFQGIWIASAFKGATGPDKMITNVKLHLDNHIAWMDLVDRWRSRIKFKGIALTGWQRYDHFAVLCELLPVAIPSLTVCLQYLEGKVIDENIMTTVLKCDFPFAWGPSDIMTSLRPGSSCGYPGSSLYHLINSLYMNLQAMNVMDKDVARGWFSWYNIVYNYSNPAHVEEASNMIDYHRIQLQYLEEKLRRELLFVYDSHTANEWLETFLTPSLIKLISFTEARDRLLQGKVWPRRPLDRLANEKRVLEKVCDGTGSLQCSLLGFNN